MQTIFITLLDKSDKIFLFHMDSNKGEGRCYYNLIKNKKETKSNEERHRKKRSTRLKFLLLRRLSLEIDDTLFGDAVMALILLFFY